MLFQLSSSLPSSLECRAQTADDASRWLPRPGASLFCPVRQEVSSRVTRRGHLVHPVSISKGITNTVGS